MGWSTIIYIYTTLRYSAFILRGLIFYRRGQAQTCTSAKPLALECGERLKTSKRSLLWKKELALEKLSEISKIRNPQDLTFLSDANGRIERMQSTELRSGKERTTQTSPEPICLSASCFLAALIVKKELKRLSIFLTKTSDHAGRLHFLRQEIHEKQQAFVRTVWKVRREPGTCTDAESDWSGGEGMRGRMAPQNGICGGQQLTELWAP